VLVPWKLRGGGGGGSGNEPKNPSEDDRKEERIFQRYYHVFEEGELEGLVEQVEELRVVHSYYDQGNWCVIAERV
jgi:alkylated DNA repair protein alkB family protein 8